MCLAYLDCDIWGKDFQNKLWLILKTILSRHWQDFLGKMVLWPMWIHTRCHSIFNPQERSNSQKTNMEAGSVHETTP